MDSHFFWQIVAITKQLANTFAMSPRKLFCQRLDIAKMRYMSKKEQNRSEEIREQIKNLPSGSGLYFMKAANDKVLYIGKAKNLRSRVASYFQQSADLLSSRGPKIVEMVNKTETVDFFETETEVEAMLQEARLIKDIHPPYNTDLVDDKTFPYLEITTSQDFPGIYITRKPQLKGSRLIGPFTNVKDLRQAMVVLQKIFKFYRFKQVIKSSKPHSFNTGLH